jgi:multiple sugar transport system permease protein
MRVYTDAFVNNSIYEGAATSFILITMTVAATVLVSAAARRLTRRQSR